jgi:CBS domain containing-hemolysin-like protein
MLKEQTVESCMKPMSFAVTLNATELLTPELVNKLVSTGLSRFPVWSTSKDHIKGYLMLKSLLYLIFMDPRDAPMVRDVRLFEPILQVKNEPLLELSENSRNMLHRWPLSSSLPGQPTQAVTRHHHR